MNSLINSILTSYNITFLIITVILLISTKYIMILLFKNKFKKEKSLNKAILLIRSLIIWIFLIFVVKDIIFVDHDLKGFPFYISKGLSILFIYILSFSTYEILAYFIEIKIGNSSNKRRQENSRLVWKLMLKIVIFITAVIIILNITELSDILGLGATIASIGVFLGLTSGTWFPPIKSGLLMLFSNLISEEDLIEVPELNIYGIVNSIGLFSTVIRNEVDNHRIYIANNKLENSVINNLSKLSRVGGLREKLIFNIGYLKNNNEKFKSEEIREFFKEAFEKVKKSSLPININFDKDIEIFLDNPGDHALTWHVFYYSDNEKTRIKDKSYIYEIFFNYSVEKNISLSTPTTMVILENNIINKSI